MKSSPGADTKYTNINKTYQKHYYEVKYYYQPNIILFTHCGSILILFLVQLLFPLLNIVYGNVWQWV